MLFENRMLRRLCGSRRDEVTGSWRNLYNEDLHNLYSLSIIKSRRMRLTGHVARVEEKRNAYRILVGKPERKRPPEIRT
jgi:hypothetical protein